MRDRSTATLLVSILTVAACGPVNPAAGSGSGAAPRLSPYQAGSVSLQIPAGWNVQLAADGLLTATQDPDRADSPILWLRLPAPASGQTADAFVGDVVRMYGSTAAIVEQQDLPDGSGKLAVLDAQADGRAVRVGVVAVVAGGAATQAILQAPAPEFDTLGGMNLLAAVLGSLGGGAASVPEPATATATSGAPAGLGGPRDVAWWNDCRASSNAGFCESLWRMRRAEKHALADRDELPAGSLPTDAIVGSWGIGGGATRDVVVGQTATHDIFRQDSHGNGEVFTFERGGRYTFTKVTAVTTGTCRSRGVETETGRYRFDGRMLAVVPARASGVFSICGGAPKEEPSKSSLGERRYELGLAGDGHLVFVGPRCMAYDEADASCDRGRWDAAPLGR